MGVCEYISVRVLNPLTCLHTHILSHGVAEGAGVADGVPGPGVGVAVGVMLGVGLGSGVGVAVGGYGGWSTKSRSVVTVELSIR